MRICPLASAVLVLALGAAMAGCGGGDKSENTSDSPSDKASESASDPVPSRSELSEALLRVEDLGDNFVVTEKDDDAPPSGGGGTGFGENLGCLRNLSSGSFAKAERSAKARYEADYATKSPTVLSKVSAYQDADDIKETIAKVRSAIADCKRIDTTGSAGVNVYDLRVETDDDAGDGVTQRFTITALGQATTQGVSYPFGLRMSFTQVGHVLIANAFITASRDVADDADAVDALTVERLQAALSGEEPDPDSLELDIVTEEDLSTTPS